MFEDPDIQDERIVAALRDAYGLRAVHVALLPLGADADTVVYRAVAKEGTAYFVKLRRASSRPP